MLDIADAVATVTLVGILWRFAFYIFHLEMVSSPQSFSRKTANVHQFPVELLSEPIPKKLRQVCECTAGCSHTVNQFNWNYGWL